MKKFIALMLLGVLGTSITLTGCTQVSTKDGTKNVLAGIETSFIPKNIDPEMDASFNYKWTSENFLSLSSKQEFETNVETLVSNSAITVDVNAREKLETMYNIKLLDGSVAWSDEYATILLNTVSRVYNYPTNPTTWVLSKERLSNDIYVKNGESTYICLSEYALKYAAPIYAESNGVKGTISSNRLYYAIVRYASNSGSNIEYIDALLRNDYGCSIIVDDYAELTKYTTKETAANFEQFKPNELLAIVRMFAEMPNAYDKIENLKYLVRRIDGNSNPVHPDAAAVAWDTTNGYIEFMDDTFVSNDPEDSYRLIAHEKSHFIWYSLDADLQKEWIKIGGWEKVLGEWTTTKETEFVTAYAHDISPSEDFAESMAYYLLWPNHLKNVSKEKYDFIRTNIMNSQEYMIKIDENMTFEVYNNFPDYDYPGKVSEIEIDVTGRADEDKQVTVIMKVDTRGDVQYGATKAYTRITAPDGRFYDLWLDATDDTQSVLKGTLTVSKYACSGNWTSESIKLVDAVGNSRFCEANTYGWEMSIMNALADYEQPQYDKSSVRIETEQGVIDDRHVTLVHVKFNATDNVGIRTVYAEITNETTNGYRLAEYGQFNNETGEGVVTFIFPEYQQSGDYVVSRIMMIDYAEHRNCIDFNKRTYPARFTFNSEASDKNAPVLDLNNISVTATPTHPEDPDGETKVVLEYFATDDISGLDMVSFVLLDPTGKTHFFYHYHDNFHTTFFEGDPTAATKYVAEVVLPRGSAPGTWGVLEITLTDKASNRITYNFSEIVHFNVN